MAKHRKLPKLFWTQKGWIVCVKHKVDADSRVRERRTRERAHCWVCCKIPDCNCAG